MAKPIIKKEMVKIDFEQSIFRFYNVELISVGFNELHLITSYGSLGNRGRENVKRFSNFSEARKLALKTIYEKKTDGFVNKYKLKDHMKPFLEKEHPFNNNQERKPCSVCGKGIPIKMYKKIDHWGRHAGNWDENPDFVGHNKVLCIDCQVNYGIHRKRVGLDELDDGGEDPYESKN